MTMGLAIGSFLGVSLLIVVVASVFTNIKLWGAAGDVFRSLRELPRDQRRRVFRWSAFMYLVLGAYCALFVIHPLGLRDTFVWFLIAPFLIAAPLGVLATGVRAWRRPRQQPERLSEPRDEDPDDKRG